MTVLKSFELNGNKQSFANWISNLSPKETPFTSMIGKEGVNQTQYSWQTDALAPATTEAITEGEQFKLQTRASTEVLTNYTSILRKVVRVSDSAMKIATHGRNNEMAYQLRKSSSEMLRDLEFMNLSIAAGRVGTPARSSRHAGFKELVAGAGHPDPDTGAIVHKSIPWRIHTGEPAFALSDIFDITTNLFVAGSVADKIMFHPMHMPIFSNLLSYNEESPLTYRMFDNLDDKFNMAVCKVKDPLGRLYSLIPNRYMPKTEIYFFNESDWTQTVLRSPQRTMLGKTGSSDQMMIEMEVGLRHKHPYASGVLTVVPSEYEIDLTPKGPIVFTAFTGLETNHVQATVTDEDGTPRIDYDVTFLSSNTGVAVCDPVSSKTIGAGVASSTVSSVGVGTTTLKAVGDKGISDSVTIEVKPPIMTNDLDKTSMVMGEEIVMTAGVKRHSGVDITTALNVKAVWHASSPNIKFTNAGAPVTSSSVDDNEAAAHIKSTYPGTYNVWFTVGTAKSPERTITVLPPGIKMDWNGTPKPAVTLDIDVSTQYPITVKDRTGAFVAAGTKVDWTSSDPSVATFEHTSTTVIGAAGTTTNGLKPIKAGAVTITANCYGDTISRTVVVGAPIVETSITPNAAAKNKATSLQTQVLDVLGNPIANVVVKWSSDQSTQVELTATEGTTSAGTGIAETTVKGIRDPGYYTVTGAVHNKYTSSASFDVGQRGVLSLIATPSTVPFGSAAILTGHLTSRTGDFIADEDITFTTNDTAAAPITKSTTTGLGAYQSLYAPSEIGTWTIEAKSVGLNASKTINVSVIDPGYVLTTTSDKAALTVGIPDRATVRCKVMNGTDPVVNRAVTVASSDASAITLINTASLVTDAKGEVAFQVEAKKIGNATISCRATGSNSVGTFNFSMAKADIKLEMTPSNFVEIGQSVACKVTVTKADGSPAASQRFSLISEPHLSLTAQTTGADGTASFNFSWPRGTVATDTASLRVVLEADHDVAVVHTLALVDTGVVVNTRNKRSAMSTDIDDVTEFTVEVTDIVTGLPVADVDVILTATNTNAITIVNAIGKTDAQGKFVTDIAAENIGSTLIEVDVRGKTVSSAPIVVDEPNASLTTDYSTIHIGESFKVDLFARHANSNEFIDSKPVVFHCSDMGAQITPSNRATTDAEGEATCVVKPSAEGTVSVWAILGDYVVASSNVDVLNVTSQEVNASVDREEVTTGVNDAVTISVDTHGVPEGTPIQLASVDGAFTFDHGSGVVDSTGKWTTMARLNDAIGEGVTSIIVNCSNETLNIDMLVSNPKIKVWIDPATAVEGSDLTVTTLVTDAKGNALGQIFDVGFLASAGFVGIPNSVKTNSVGIAEFKVKAPAKGNHTIRATVGRYVSPPGVVNTGELVLNLYGNLDSKLNINTYLDVEAEVVIGGTASRDVSVWATSNAPSSLVVLAPSSGLTGTNGRFKFQLSSLDREGNFDVTFGVRDTVSGVTKSVTKTITVGNTAVQPGIRVQATAKYPNTTVGIGQTNEIEVVVTDVTRKIDGLVVTAKDPKGLFIFTPDSGLTDADGKWKTTVTHVGIVGDTTIVRIECANKTSEIAMAVRAPVINVDVSPNPALENSEITATASVFLEDGVTPVDAGIDFSWDVDPATLPEFNVTTLKTDAKGQVVTKTTLTANNDFEFIGVVDIYESAPVTLKIGTMAAEVTADTTGNMSSNVNDQRTFRAKATVAGLPAAGMNVALTSSNVNVLTIEGGGAGVTNASGEYAFIGVARTGTGTVTITAVLTDPVTSKTTTGSINATIRNPKVNTIIPETEMKIHTEMDFYIEVLDQNGDPVKGIEVEPLCDVPSSGLICDDTTTDKDGKVFVKILPIAPGDHRVRGKVGSFTGLPKTIAVKNTVQAAEIVVEPLGIGSKTIARASVLNDNGTPMSGGTVTWTVNPLGVVISGNPITTTDSNGFAELELTGVSRGTGVVSFEVAGMTAPDKTFLVGHGATVTTSHTPEKPLINRDVTHKVVLKRTSDNAPIANTEVVLNCTPPAGAFAQAKVTTNAQGIAEFTHQFVDENTHTISTMVPSLAASASHVVSVRDLRITSEISKSNMVYDDTNLPLLTIRMMNNTTPIAGSPVELRCVPDGCFFEYVGGQVTDSNGYIRVNVRPRDIGNFQLSARSEGVESNKSALTVTDVAFRYSVSGDDRFMTAHIGQTSAVTCGVLEFGVPAVWKTLRYSTHDVDMIDIVPRDGGSAGATGFNTIDINPKKVGKSLIRVQADGAAEFVEFTVEAKDPIVHLNCSPNPADGTEDVNYTLKVTDVHGAAAQGVSLELYHTAIFNNYVPRGNSDANGELLHIRKIAQPGTYPMQTYIPHASHVRSPMMNMVIKDRPYVYSVLGNLTKATNGIDLTHEVTIVVRENNVLQSGVVIEHRSDSQMVSVSGNRYSTDAAGTLILLVKPKKTGVARIEFRAKGNSEWHHFDLTIGAPELRIVVSPTTLQAGKEITFSASVRDANANYVPGKTIKWSHPINMLMNQYKLPDAVGDPLYGSVAHTARAGAWGTHQVFWYVEDISVRSNIVNVTSHM